MMQRKVFYTIVQKGGIVGLEMQNGYEIRVDGVKLYAYKSEEDRNVYIIDPDNGIALSTYDCTNETEDILMEIELIKKAKEELARNGNLKKWKEIRERESYQLTIRMFRAYKRAEILREKQKEAAYCEMEAAVQEV